MTGAGIVHVSRFTFHLALAVLLLAASHSPAAPATTQSDLPLIPDTVIAEIEVWVTPPEEEPADVEKIRRFNKAMRLSVDAQREYPQAPNLHIVRNLMLTAAQHLAVLDNSDENRQRILDIANRIMDSEAPDEAKLQADLLLTQVKIAEGNDRDIAGHIQRFMRRHAKSAPAATRIYAIMLAQANGQSIDKMADELQKNYIDEPGVRAFLRTNLGRTTDIGRSFKTTLTRLDGSKLVLPRDLFGKTVVLQYYSLRSPMCLPAMDQARKFYGEFKTEAEVVSISIDPSRPETEKFVKEQKMDWTVIFSGLGRKDPTAQSWGVSTVPYYWFITSDGRNTGNDFYQWTRTGEWNTAARGMVETSRGLNQQIAFYATGAFIVTTPPSKPIDVAPATSQPIATPVVVVDSAKDIPQALVDRMESLVVYPIDGLTDAQKLSRYLATIELGTSIEKNYPAAPDLHLIRNRILSAAQGIAWTRRDTESWERVKTLAEAARKTDMPAEAKLLPEFLLLQRQVMLGQVSDADAAGAARELVSRYAKTPAATNSLMCAVILSLELGNESLRAEVMTPLHSSLDKPFVRQMLRHIFKARIDTGLPFNATLTKTDGTKLKLPDDLRGKVVMITFWTKARGIGFPAFAGLKARPGFSTDDVVMVCISLDGTAPDAEALSKAYGMPQIHTFSGLGRYDPTALYFGVTSTPSMWTIGRNGNVFADEQYGDWGWAMQQQLADPKPPRPKK